MKVKTMVGLRSPWILHVEKVKALFGRDEGVSVDYDDNKKCITLRAASSLQADALARILPDMVDFGDVTILQRVVPGNIDDESLPENAPMIDIIKAAFNKNKSCVEIRPVSKGLFKDLTYCVFAKEVIQYSADNLADLNGNESTLMECIARDVLTKADGVFFCTSMSSSGVLGADSQQLDKPLGEWP